MLTIRWWLGYRRRRGAAAITICALAMFTLAGTASAHVTANPGTAKQGGFTKVSFRVPNERDIASTSQLEISFAANHPIPFVSTRAIPGWTWSVEKTKLDKPIKTADGEITEVISKITWTGGKIAPGMFEDFDVSLGPLPTDTNELVFKALQIYDNGEVVRWIDTAPEGAAEPEHPAPVLKLTAAEATPTTTATEDTTGSSTGVVLGMVGTVLGLIGIALGLLNRRSAASG